MSSSTTSLHPASSFSRVHQKILATITVTVIAALIFYGLGHYALWDDEAGTALTAKSILRTGDATAWVDDHNIFAYHEGAELRGLKLRRLPALHGPA